MKFRGHVKSIVSWLLLAAPGCSWLLLAAPGCSWLLLARARYSARAGADAQHRALQELRVSSCGDFPQNPTTAVTYRDLGLDELRLPSIMLTLNLRSVPRIRSSVTGVLGLPQICHCRRQGQKVAMCKEFFK